ncbi:hypothetical protein NEHOM01_2385 [Nematocida homosporus]|uniref:uncharacterized protein n=1 Tax=Nematocida homosporus TaxID=1912981 RepID=UPI00222103CC|nr:uncharacterized protein NEHOM01_2385 [Nematocida homosporus]KAI5187809.1 hypothetical protein NEHOM01_2385 [Nematocida homosporus]
MAALSQPDATQTGALTWVKNTFNDFINLYKGIPDAFSAIKTAYKATDGKVWDAISLNKGPIITLIATVVVILIILTAIILTTIFLVKRQRALKKAKVASPETTSTDTQVTIVDNETNGQHDTITVEQTTAIKQPTPAIRSEATKKASAPTTTGAFQQLFGLVDSRVAEKVKLDYSRPHSTKLEYIGA